MGAPKGNDYNKKLKNEDERQAAYKSYCDWIAAGKSYKSWCYESPTLTLSYKCMETHMKDSPNDFPPLQRSIALAKGFAVWEELGKQMMTSKEKCHPAIYQIMMRNKFGWDKEDPEDKEKKEKQDAERVDLLMKGLEVMYKNKILEKELR